MNDPQEPQNDPTASLVVPSGPTANVARKLPTVQGYRIVDVVGQGGMGTVYRAVQTRLNRSVALKVLHAVIATANPTAVSRFRREASAAARLHHTNIIPIYDYGESQDGYFYAMELVSGQPLDVLIRRFMEGDAVSASPGRLAELLMAHTSAPTTSQERLSKGAAATEHRDSSLVTSATGRGRVYFNQVARWMADAASGLHYAHDEGIIHRDIKPANLMLSTDGRIMIADFGLAKTIGDESVTMTGSLLGTLRYMSPEQAMAKRVRLDHRTDLYSLGATMYELLCFQPVFSGQDDKELLGQIISREPMAPRKVNPRVPTELETICLKCLEKSPNARYETAAELADDLQRYMSDLPLMAKRPGPLRRLHKFARRHRTAVVAVTSAVLLFALSAFLIQEQSARRDAVRKRIQGDLSALYESGMYFVAEHKWDSAIVELDRALMLDPLNVKALVGAAWARLEYHKAMPDLAGTNALEEAETLCRRILSFDTTNVQALNLRGVALRRLQRFPEAIQVIQYAVDLDPTQYAAWSNLGALYAITDDFENAVRCLREGARRAGRDNDDYHAAVWRNLAVMELAMETPDAFDHICVATECHREGGLNWLARARIRLELPGHIDADDALDCAEHADFLANETDGRAKRYRALAHLRKGELAHAVLHAGRAIELGDLPAYNHLIIAVAEAQRDRRTLATEHLGAAKAAWPEKLSHEAARWATVRTGDLWIESAERLFSLRQEAENLVNAMP